MASEGFMPYFGQGIPLATHVQPIDTRSILDSITNLALQLKREQDDQTAMQDPTLQAILGGLMPSGAGGQLPNPTPPHPALVDQTMASVRSMVDGLHGIPTVQPGSTPQAFDPSIHMQDVAPGLKVGVGQVRLESQKPSQEMIPYPTPDFRPSPRLGGPSAPAVAQPPARRQMSPEAFQKLTQILQPYSQIESTRIAASGREDTQRLKDAASLERTQLRTALGVLESMRKRDADWLIYDAKIKKIQGAGKVGLQDRKDLMKAAQLAQQDANDAARILSSETVAGLAAAEPGSLAREQYDNIVREAQKKAERAQTYQGMVDALTRAGLGGSQKKGSKPGAPQPGAKLDLQNMSEEDLLKLAGG